MKVFSSPRIFKLVDVEPSPTGGTTLTMWGFLSPIRQAAGGADSSTRSATKAPPVTPASCAKASSTRLEPGSAQSDKRDMLVKVTFHAIHDSAPENAAMFLTGSLPSLGSWDVKRARRMERAQNGAWALAIYIPEKAEFLYQYLLLQEPEKDAANQEPVVLWEGGLERKCRLVDRCCTASPRKRLPLLEAPAVCCQPCCVQCRRHSRLCRHPLTHSHPAQPKPLHGGLRRHARRGHDQGLPHALEQLGGGKGMDP